MSWRKDRTHSHQCGSRSTGCWYVSFIIAALFKLLCLKVPMELFLLNEYHHPLASLYLIRRCRQVGVCLLDILMFCDRNGWGDSCLWNAGFACNNGMLNFQTCSQLAGGWRLHNDTTYRQRGRESVLFEWRSGRTFVAADFTACRANGSSSWLTCWPWWLRWWMAICTPISTTNRSKRHPTWANQTTTQILNLSSCYSLDAL